MATDWYLKGDELGHCNCAWGCPCQFNALPTHGDCRAVIGFDVREGRYGDVSLDGTRFASIVSWPGPIHEGDGTIQLVIDEGCSEEQRDALLRINSGEEGGAYFEIFASVLPHVREPIIASVEFEMDAEQRTGRLKVGDVAETRVEPITNPVTGEEHRVRIVIPGGFEYHEAEVGNTVVATATAEAPLDFTLENTYAQLNTFDWSNAG